MIQHVFSCNPRFDSAGIKILIQLWSEILFKADSYFIWNFVLRIHLPLWSALSFLLFPKLKVTSNYSTNLQNANWMIKNRLSLIKTFNNCFFEQRLMILIKHVFSLMQQKSKFWTVLIKDLVQNWFILHISDFIHPCELFWTCFSAPHLTKMNVSEYLRYEITFKKTLKISRLAISNQRFFSIFQF